MSDYLLIGPVLLQGFELPARIEWGGAQRLAIHRLPGGQRVIDSLGRDDCDIVWSGVFTGSDAGLRARAIDLMRAGGAVWPLTWSSFFYSVVIAKFEADYTRENWIPYSIACTVLRDEAEAVVEAVIGLAATTLGDLASANGFSSGLDVSQAQSLVAAPSGTVGGTAAYLGSLGALAGLQSQASSGIAAAGASMLTSSNSAAGLTQATNSAGQLATLSASRGYVARASGNLQTNPG